MEQIVDILCNGRQPTEAYPEFVRKFCMSIHYYSPRAYDYIRAKFNNHLPHISTIRSWYANSNVDATPGINRISLEILKEKADKMKSIGKQLVCDMIFDEASVRKHIQWCPKNRSFMGYVTYGYEGNPNVDELPVANQVIVFMISGINEFFQIPIAYYFIRTLDAFEREDLLTKVLKEVIEKTGIRIASVTFDGYLANATMCERLGAILKGDIKPSFINPFDGNEIQIMLDPSHAEKLVRSSLYSLQVIYDGDDNKIEWKHFADLYKYSKDNNFGLTHKITKKHIDFHTRSMCVRTAVELLSNSTANALQFLMENKVPEFVGASGSIKFTRIFDKLFDVMNTVRIKPGNIYKSALNPANKQEIFNFLNEAKEYILSLKVMNKSKTKKIPIVHSRLKTGFRGYVMNVISVINLYREFVEKEELMPFLATYRLSQDHLEMFFGKLRSMNGANDNMTVQQFTSAYKKLLHNCDIRISSYSNIFNGCASNILTVTSRRAKLYDDLDGDVPVNTALDTQSNNDDISDELDELGKLDRNKYLIEQGNMAGIAFIANSIEYRLLSTDDRDNMTCHYCRQVLERNEKIDAKLCVQETQPCKSTFQICKLTDTAIKILLSCSSQSNFKQKVYVYVLSNININSLYFNYFEDEGHDIDHKHYLIKHIIDEYTRIKCTYLSKIKTMNMQQIFLRNKFRKLVQFAGQ